MFGRERRRMADDHPDPASTHAASSRESDQTNTTANTCPAPGTTTIPKSHGQSTPYIAIVLGIVATLLDATAPASVSASSVFG